MSPAGAAQCSATTGVSVVVDFNHGAGGGIETACDPQAVEASTPARSSRPPGSRSRRARRIRLPGQVRPGGADCSQTAPANAYWGLFWAKPGAGSWTYATSGVGGLRVPEGGSVAWAFQDGGDTDFPGAGRRPSELRPRPPRSRPRRRPRRRAVVAAVGVARRRPQPSQASQADHPDQGGRDERNDGDADSGRPCRREGEGRKAKAKASASARPSRECDSFGERIGLGVARRPRTATRRPPSRPAVSSPRRSRTAACPSGCRSWCSSGSAAQPAVRSGGVGGPARHDRAAAGEGPPSRSLVALGDGPRRRGHRHHQPLPAAADRRGGRPDRLAAAVGPPVVAVVPALPRLRTGDRGRPRRVPGAAGRRLRERRARAPAADPAARLGGRRPAAGAADPGVAARRAVRRHAARHDRDLRRRRQLAGEPEAAAQVDAAGALRDRHRHRGLGRAAAAARRQPAPRAGRAPAAGSARGSHRPAARHRGAGDGGRPRAVDVAGGRDGRARLRARRRASTTGSVGRPVP